MRLTWLLLLLLSCNNPKNLDSLETEIYQRYQKFETANIDSYKDDCEKEFQNNISFPLDPPAYAIIYDDDLLKSSQKLSTEKMNNILVILNDTSSFIWGELGTPYYDRQIAFFNDSGYCIGLTKIDYGGQTYSHPHPKKMKWGMLNENALEKMKELLEN